MRIVSSLDIAPVWSGHPVGFALLTTGGRQYVTFYDAERRMTVASRDVGSASWQLDLVPETVGWNSHNFIAIAADTDGCLHLSGNMHNRQLIYYRTRQPHDAATFEAEHSMVGREENRCTYPQFLTGPRGELVFTYRDGCSGNGVQIVNAYDPASRAWTRLLDTPLFDGQDQMSAYHRGPVTGPDGRYHMTWLWRDTPDCRTNHDISYARSTDLVRWETAGGHPLPLPITPDAQALVDPVPACGGALNGQHPMGFDARNRAVISCMKYDEVGNSQIYLARVEDGRWRFAQATRWDWRWAFEGMGAIPAGIQVAPIELDADGRMVQSFHHVEYGYGSILLDDATLAPVGEIDAQWPFPASLGEVESAWPGMEVQWAGDLGRSQQPGVRYVLRWETAGANRDRPREGPVPPPTMLRLYERAG